MSFFSARLPAFIEELGEGSDCDMKTNWKKEMAQYCPHIGLGGANIFVPVYSEGRGDSASTTTESVCSSLSGASTIPAVELSSADNPIVPLSPPPVLSNGPTSSPCLQKCVSNEEDSVNENDTTLSDAGSQRSNFKNETSDSVDRTDIVVVNGNLEVAVSGDTNSADSLDVIDPQQRIPSVTTSSSNSASTSRSTSASTARSRCHKRLRPSCSDCEQKTNLWRCLGLDCGLVFCGAKGADHAHLHFKENSDHAIQENVSSHRLWCNLCEHEVFKDFRNRRSLPAVWFPVSDSEVVPPRGLYNIGNTCYMNAALQNIAAVAPLTSYFMGDTFHDDKTKSRRVSDSYRIFLDDLFGHSNSSYLSAVMPSRLLYAIRLAHPIFRGFHQHDSQEFLRLFMDTLASETKVPHFSLDENSCCNQDCHNDSDTESFETADSGNASEETMSTNGNNLKTEDLIDSTETNDSSSPSVKIIMKSIIDDVFNGQIESSVQCLSCHETSRRLEPFQDLSLPIPTRDEITALHQRGERYGVAEEEEPTGWIKWFILWLKWFIWGPSPTIYECLAAFFSADELKGKNKYSCENCKVLRNGIKRCSLYHLPEVLCVHLKRFRMLEVSPNLLPLKICQSVKFPVDDLDVRPFLHPDCTDSVSSYRLMGVICHHGSVGMGHYTAYIRKGETWFLTDDCRVIEVSVQEVESCEAYVLFYQKWDVEQEESDVKREILKCWSDCDANVTTPTKFHLVSRKWLGQYLWGEEGIPLDNSDVVCPHGRLIPVDNLDKSATWVPDLVWNAIITRYGGGPDLESLECCKTCAVAWRKYQRPLTQQRTTSAPQSSSFSSLDFEALQRFLTNRRATGSTESLSSNSTVPDWQ